MESFPIHTFTIVDSAHQVVLHSPALARVGVPYTDVTDSKASRLTIVSYDGAERSAELVDGELRLTLSPGEFERLERALVEAPRRECGKQYPYSVIEQPVRLQFDVDNDGVTKFVMPW